MVGRIAARHEIALGGCGGCSDEATQGMQVLYSGGITTVPDEIVRNVPTRRSVGSFAADGRSAGSASSDLVDTAVARAHAAFQALGDVPDAAIGLL